MSADEQFGKALRSFETYLLVNNNFMQKIISIIRIINNIWRNFQNYFSAIIYSLFNLSNCELDNFSFNPIQDGLFWSCLRIWGRGFLAPVPKICHTYPTMMKFGTVVTWHTPWLLLTSTFFHRKSANFVISKNTDIDCILV